MAVKSLGKLDRSRPLSKPWPQISFTKEFSREKLMHANAWKEPQPPMLGAWGGLGRRGLEMARERRARSAKRGHLRSLEREHRSSRHIPGQWGAPHRKVTATRRLYIISRRAARHLRGTLRAAPPRAAVRGATAWEPGWGAQMAGTGSGDARDRGSWGLRAGAAELVGTLGAGRGSRDAAAREQGRGSGVTERDQGAVPIGDRTRPGRAQGRGPSVRGATPGTPARALPEWLCGTASSALPPT